MDQAVRSFLAASVVELRGRRSQREFASLIGVSQSAVQGWESEKHTPNLENLEKLATLKGMLVEEYVAYLYGRSKGETVPVEKQIKGMPRERLAALLEAIAAELREH